MERQCISLPISSEQRFFLALKRAKKFCLWTPHQAMTQPGTLQCKVPNSLYNMGCTLRSKHNPKHYLILSVRQTQPSRCSISRQVVSTLSIEFRIWSVLAILQPGFLTISPFGPNTAIYYVFIQFSVVMLSRALCHSFSNQKNLLPFFLSKN